jgi:hypothetical protein
MQQLQGELMLAMKDLHDVTKNVESDVKDQEKDMIKVLSTMTEEEHEDEERVTEEFNVFLPLFLSAKKDFMDNNKSYEELMTSVDLAVKKIPRRCPKGVFEEVYQGWEKFWEKWRSLDTGGKKKLCGFGDDHSLYNFLYDDSHAIQEREKVKVKVMEEFNVFLPLFLSAKRTYVKWAENKKTNEELQTSVDLVVKEIPRGCLKGVEREVYQEWVKFEGVWRSLEPEERRESCEFQYESPLYKFLHDGSRGLQEIQTERVNKKIHERKEKKRLDFEKFMGGYISAKSFYKQLPKLCECNDEQLRKLWDVLEGVNVDITSHVRSYQARDVREFQWFMYSNFLNNKGIWEVTDKVDVQDKLEEFFRIF